MALLVAACSKGTLGDSCEDSGDCKEPLFCAKAGEVKSTCTISCAGDAFSIHESVKEPDAKYKFIDRCRMEFGDRAYCHVEGYCAVNTR